MARGRVTKHEKLQRDEELKKCILQGMSETEIVKVYTKKWQCTDTNVRKYLWQIAEQFRNAQIEALPALKNKYLARLEMLFKEAREAGNLKTALDIQKEINKICGLHDEKRDDDVRAPIITISERDVTPLHLNRPEGSTDGNTDDEGS